MRVARAQSHEVVTGRLDRRVRPVLTVPARLDDHSRLPVPRAVDAQHDAAAAVVRGAHEGLVVDPVPLLGPVLVRGNHFGLGARRDVVHPQGQRHVDTVAPQPLPRQQHARAVRADLAAVPGLGLGGVVQQLRTGGCHAVGVRNVVAGDRDPPQLRALHAAGQQGADGRQQPRPVRGHRVVEELPRGQLDTSHPSLGVQEPQGVLRCRQVVVPVPHGRAVVEDGAHAGLVPAVVDLPVAGKLVRRCPGRGVHAGDEEHAVPAQLQVRDPVRGVQHGTGLAVLGEQPQPGAFGIVAGRLSLGGEVHGPRSRGTHLLHPVLLVGQLHRRAVAGNGPRMLHEALAVRSELLAQDHHRPVTVGQQSCDPRGGHELLGVRVAGGHVSQVTGPRRTFAVPAAGSARYGGPGHRAAPAHRQSREPGVAP